jgi:hypothetical protein
MNGPRNVQQLDRIQLRLESIQPVLRRVKG